MASEFRDSFAFLDKIGVFDVVLPFILVFTIVFAILDKTRVLGTDDISGKKYPKKNLNSMIAFVTAFFVVASSKLVEIITSVSANVVILLLSSVLFMLLVGSFYQQTEEGFFIKEGFTRNALTIIMFLGLVMIFLNAIKTNDKTWLDVVIDFFGNFWESPAVASVVLLLVMIGFLYFITKEPGKPAKKEGG